MASRDTPGFDHKYEDHPHNHEVHSTVIHEVGEHDDHHQEQQQQQQHEKKSVLKKVKAKAKKIKDTLGIKKHEHGHGHGHEHDQHEHHPHHEDDEDLDEEDDNEDDAEELEQDPEVHGAPVYESKTPSKFVEDKKVISDQPRVHFGQMPPPLEPDLHAPKDRFGTGTAPPVNYQTKVTDQTGAGGKEVDVESFISSFGKMEVTSSNDPDSSNQKSSSSIPTQTEIGTTGSHDKSPPDYSSIPTQTYPTPEQSQSIPETKHQETNVVGEHQPTNQSSKSSSYTEKLSTATYAIADKAISAKNVVASKLGYGAGSNDMADKNKGTGSGLEAISASIPTQTEIGTGTTGSQSPDYSSIPTQTYPTPEQSQSIPESKHEETNLVGEHQPTNQSSKSSSYTEKLSTATYAIADKAISAKNVVASKLGYGAGSNDMADKNKGTGSGTVGYGKQVASAVTDKVAPVYEKVAGAGSAVVSKVSGTGKVEGQGSDTGTGHGGVKGPDKGVTKKGYLAEKFRPSEEDKALSEVISEALHKRNEDAKRKEDEDHSKKVKEAMGRVTESEEVVKRLGTDDEVKTGPSGSDDSGVIVGGGSGSGTGMVDRMRGTVASWFGGTNKGGQTQPTTESHSPSSNVGEKQEDMLSHTRQEGMSHVDENVGEERRPQESTN